MERTEMAEQIHNNRGDNIQNKYYFGKSSKYFKLLRNTIQKL